MRAQDIEAKADFLGVERGHICFAARVLVPVLEEAKAGRVFWVKWAIQIVINALNDYQARNCGDQ